MRQISPEQEKFTQIRTLCIDLFGKSKVFDFRPPENTEFPFVHIGEQLKQNNRTNKEKLNKQTQITLHFWHDNWLERGTLTKMMGDTETAIIKAFGVRGEEIDTQVIEDTSTNTSLMHGILETNIKY